MAGEFRFLQSEQGGSITYMSLMVFAFRAIVAATRSCASAHNRVHVYYTIQEIYYWYHAFAAGARSISIVTAFSAFGTALGLSEGYRSHALRAASAMRGLFQNSRERTSFR